MDLTARDRDLIDALGRVRVMSLAQIARTWWCGSSSAEASVRRRIAAMERAGLLRRLDLLSKPELALSEPVVCWQPGLAEPDFGQVSHRLRRSWGSHSAQLAACVLHAGSGRAAPRDTEVTHDLHVTAVYLDMRRQLPTRARSWVFETELTPWGDYLPDAIVRDGRSWTAIEFGGEYSATKLQRIHEACARKERGYELW